MRYILFPFLLLLAAVTCGQIVPNASPVAAPVAPAAALPAAYNSAAKINYVRTWVPWRPETDETLVPTYSVSDVKQTTAYVDGLGRTIQTVNKQLSPGGKDHIAYTTLDDYSRPSLQYLLYVSSGIDGYFKTNPFAEQKAYYSTAALNGNQYAGEQIYYGRTEYEAAPLGRTTKVLAAGNAWAGSNRGTGQEYRNNTAGEGVRIWTVAAAAGSVPATTAIYPAGKLVKNTSIDEHGKKLVEYKDKAGRLLLKKVQLAETPGEDHTGWLCTYYIYDDFGLLRCVIQPRGVELLIGSWTLTTELLNEQCFRYEYDGRNRMIIKKVPGAQEVHMVYDALDRPVMTQDGNLRGQNKWLVTQYDKLDRPVATGLLNSSATRATHQTSAGASTSYPASMTEELTRTWYDDYSYASAKAFDNSDISKLAAGANPWPVNVAKSDLVYGKVTGMKTKVLGTASQYLISTIYYDEKGRTIQTLSDNHVGGTDIVSTRYDYGGKVLATYVKHTSSAATPSAIRVLTKMSYDAGGRLLKTWKQLNDDGNDKLIAENAYDELGQLKSKKLAPAFNSGAGLETLDYSYNIRGWLESLNKGYVQTGGSSRWFGQVLNYDHGFSKAQYNGNISGARWRSRGDGEERAYGFDYDGANRLLKADFTQNNGGWNGSAGVDFSVRMGDGIDPTLAYDANGNIKRMQQWGLKLTGSAKIDDLAYSYYTNGNRLQKVTDAVATDNKLGDFKDNGSGSNNDYGYDANGNLMRDMNKHIGTTSTNGMTYNHLNLPVTITVRAGFNSGTVKGTITYTYDASGNKLRKVTTDNTVSPAKVTTTDYVGGFVYENNVLQFAGMEEGRIRYKAAAGAVPASYQYDYFVKDHLGNVRVVLTEEQKTDAYPVASMEDVTDKNNLSDPLNYIPYYANTDYTATPSLRTARSGISGYPTDNFTTPNDYVAKTNGSGNKIGPSITLKVMAGDKINIRANSWWKSTATPGTPVNPLTDLLAALAGGVAGSTGGKITSGELTSSGVLSPSATDFLNSRTYNAARPKAYLNWILLDEQFKYAGSGSGAEQVDGSNLFKTHTHTGVTMTKSGYLYVYVSNETPNIDVFFDNLQLTHVRGPLLEETHYYPFGLTMSGISSKAFTSGVPENKKKYNGIEKEDDLQIDIYDAQLRELDQQIGRWWQIDPKTENMEMWGSYVANYDNPITFMDYLGDEPEDCCPWLKKVLISASGASNGFMNSATWGLWPTDPFGLRNNLDDEELMFYDNAVTVGQIAPLFTPGALGKRPGGGRSPGLVTATPNGLEIPVSVPVTNTPLFPLWNPNGGANNSESNNQNSQAQASSTETGSYTNTHASGKTYSGKGSQQRAAKSAKEKEQTYQDPVVSTDFTPAPNSRQAFIDEAIRIRKNGGVKSPTNYNKINSPGEKFMKTQGIITDW